MSGFGQSELLSLRKAAVRLRIARRRARLMAELERAAAPLRQVEAWLDRLKKLRYLWPVLSAVWLGLRAGSKKPLGRFRRLARWMPIAFKIIRAALKLLMPSVPDDVPDDVEAERGGEDVAGDAESGVPVEERRQMGGDDD